MTSPNPGSERRAVARVVSRQVTQICCDETAEFCHAITRDASSCAAYLYTEQKFLEGQRVEIRGLALPGKETRRPALARSGKVVRIDCIEPERKYGIAVIVDEFGPEALDYRDRDTQTSTVNVRSQIAAMLRTREVRFLITASLILLVAATLTSLWIRALHAQEATAAQHLFDRAKRAMAAGQYEIAIRDFRAVVGLLPNDSEPRLRLAEALAAAGKHDEASRRYLALRQTSPDSGSINLRLAKLQAMRDGNPTDAEFYYHAAIAGSWPTDAELNRQRARLELVRYLISRNRHLEARGELRVIAQNIPDDLGLLNEAASLLMEVGDAERALDIYDRVLAIRPHDDAALLKAAEAAYASGRYSKAQQLFKRIGNDSAQQPEIATQVQRRLQEIEEVLSIAPVHGMPAGERGDRALRVWDTVTRRLASCAGISLGSMLYARNDKEEPQVPGRLGPVYLKWQELHTQLRTSHQRWNLRNDAALQSNVMSLAYAIEQQTVESCGGPNGADRALLRLAQHPEALQQ